MIDVVKQWYGDIADLRQKYQVVCVMKDNAGKTRQKEIAEFSNSHVIRSHFSESYEQWQNGSAESTISSNMMLARTKVDESGAAGRFWFRATATGKDARNATFKARLGTSQHVILYAQYMESRETSADIEHLGAGSSYTLMRNVATRASIHHWLGKQSSWD